MLWWALAFFILAVIAAILGFGGIATAIATVAQVIFYVALAFFVISLIAYLFRGSTGTATTV